MAALQPMYPDTMNDQQRAAFYTQYSLVQKDEVVGVLLAVFLGVFGAHHFYLRRTGLGILYCVLSVTGFSAIAGLIEAFFMPERVRRFNQEQAIAIATSLGVFAPTDPALPAGSSRVLCAGCGHSNPTNVNFCGKCGKALTS